MVEPTTWWGTTETLRSLRGGEEGEEKGKEVIQWVCRKKTIPTVKGPPPGVQKDSPRELRRVRVGGRGRRGSGTSLNIETT